MLWDLYVSLKEMLTWTDALVLLVILIITWLIYKVIIIPAMSPLNKIPGDRGSLLFGLYPELLKVGHSAGFYLRKMKEMNSEIFRVHSLFGTPVVVIANREAFKYVCVLNNKNYPKAVEKYKPLINLIGYGLVTLNGEEHLTRRRLCIGAFKYAFLKTLAGKVSDHAEELMDVWNKQLNEKVDNTIDIEIIKDLSRATLDTIVHVVLDHRSTILQDPHSTISQAFEQLIGNVSVTDLLPIFKLLPTPRNLRYRRDKRILDKTVMDMVKKKKSAFRDSTDNDIKTDNLLSMLLLAKDEETGITLSEEELHDEVLTFLFAGHETTATALTWCLYSLACYQDIQQKLRDEILLAAPSEEIPLTGDHLESMTYLSCVIKETLRYHNVVAGFPRVSLKDDHIDGHFIPKGSVVYLSTSCIHLNPENWEEPHKFNPDRFQDESKIKPFSFLPFASGPRMCIGYKFAYLEMQVFLTSLLRKFKFDLTPGMENMGRKSFITTKPARPLVLKITRI